MLGTAEEEIKKSNERWTNSNFMALRDQQEVDFGLWGPHEFKMPKEEGKWEEVTTNSPKTLANKIMALLASAWLQLFIDVKEEKKKERERITNTERLANGCIWLADRKAVNVPSGKRLQSALSSNAVLRGGTVKSVYWYEEDVPECQIKSYDPFRSQWIEAGGELLWFCYRKEEPKDYIEHIYKKQIEDGFNYGNKKSVLTYTFWDADEWKVAIGGEYIDGEKHGLGYIPINIRACGSVPFMESDLYQDTLKWSWQSCFHNTRGIYDLESKLLSIEASKAIESGKIKIAGEWDSLASGNKPPQGLEKLGYGSKKRDEVVLFDTSLGQRFGGMIQPPSNEMIDRLLTRVRNEMDILPSIDPIAFGQMTRSGSGALAAELRAAALEFVNPFRECVQDDFNWIAEECVRQFKKEEYEKVTIEGRDRKREKFSLDISAKDVEEKHFDCNLVFDKLRDEIQELGAAIQKVSYGLSSRRTAMLKHNIVEDPDREMDIMDEELAAREPMFRYVKMAKYFKDMGTTEGDLMARTYMSLSSLVQENVLKKAMLAEIMPEEEKKPPIISPQAEVAGVAEQPRATREVEIPGREAGFR